MATTVPFPESPRGEVQINDDAIYASGIVLHDAELAEIVRQAPEGRRVELIERALRVGLTAIGNDMTSRLRESMRAVQTTLDQQVSLFGDRMADRVREQLGEAGKDGNVQRRVNEILSQWAGRMKADFEKSLPDVFDGPTKKSVATIQNEGERVVKEIAGLFSENGLAFNELREVRRDFTRELDQLKTAMIVAQTKAANPTPREAGLSYEAWVHGQLATIGSLRGDDVELTSGKAGRVSRCLKGDTRVVVAAEGVEVAAPPRIAVEIRDREESEFSLSDVQMMIENREAHAAVVVAAHSGSLPRQYGDRSFAISRRKRLVTVVVDSDTTGADVLLAAAYELASAMAIETVRRSRDGDWDAAARKVNEIEQAVEGIAEARTALGQIERKAHDAGSSADKRHAMVIRLLSELRAVVQTQ